jgi:hypothetical protein
MYPNVTVKFSGSQIEAAEEYTKNVLNFFNILNVAEMLQPIP